MRILLLACHRSFMARDALQRQVLFCRTKSFSLRNSCAFHGRFKGIVNWGLSPDGTADLQFAGYLCIAGKNHFHEVVYMDINYHDFPKDIINELSSAGYIKPGDIPNIELYMDQVTKFMDTHLSQNKRYPEDKILTKTMINNYTKNDLLPPPQKKRYTREHVLLLILIYYLKSFLSISDIKTLLDPLIEKYYGSDTDKDFSYIYNSVFELEPEMLKRCQNELLKSYELSSQTFPDAPEDEREYLQQFCLLCLLSFDVYIKKQIIEQTIDNIRKSTETDKKKK